MSPSPAATFWDELRDRILAIGFTPDEADAWVQGWPSSWRWNVDADGIVAEASRYRDLGVPIADAVAWNAGFTLTEATVFIEGGWPPAEAADLWLYAREQIAEWVATALSPARVLTYVRAGIEPNEVAAFEASPSGWAAVQTLAALLTKSREPGR